MPVYHPELQRHSPIRPLDWRWQRAQRLVRRGRYFSRRHDDEETGQAVSYLKRLEKCRTERQRKRLAQAHTDIDAALRLHEGGGATVLEVQARLLARQTPEEIARITELPATAIRAYEALFFNVTDKLNAISWITAAIGWWCFDPAKGRDRATILKGFAYHGGVVVLETLLPYLCGRRLETQSTDNAIDAKLDRVIRLAIEIEMLPWDVETTLKMFKMNRELHANSRKAASGGPSAGILAANSTETLEKLVADALQDAAGARRAGDNGVVNGGPENIACAG